MKSSPRRNSSCPSWGSPWRASARTAPISDTGGPRSRRRELSARSGGCAQVPSPRADATTAGGFAPTGQHSRGTWGGGTTFSLQCIASSASQALAAFVASAPPRCCDHPPGTRRRALRGATADRRGGGCPAFHACTSRPPVRWNPPGKLHFVRTGVEVGAVPGTDRGRTEVPDRARDAVNDRRTPLAVGVVGVAAGVVAALTPGVVAAIFALVAGGGARGAGALAVRMIGETEEAARDSAEAAAARHRAEVERHEGELAEARTRIEELQRELADRDDSSDPTSDDTTALTDPESQLFSEAYFRVALDARIASARRHLRPVAVALIEMFEGMAGPSAVAAPPERAAEAIRQTVRDADTACRLSDGVYAIILEDTPENGAVWTVERVRRNLVSRYGAHTMWAGVACYPAHAFSTDELLEQARAALESAREWKQDRIEVAIAE